MTLVSLNYLQPKQMEKLTSQPKLDGRQGVAENFGHVGCFLCFIFKSTGDLVLFTDSSNKIASITSADPTTTTINASLEGMAFRSATATKN